MNTFKECLDYLYQQLPMYQRVGKAALKPDLSNTIALMDLLRHPENSFRSIHIAGTNGKGTSAHALASILQSTGYTTGLYTSPHLVSFTERIRVNGEEISKQYVVDFVKENQASVEKIRPSFFEWTVALAFEYFSKKKVDVAVIEVGLGGRLDSTNVIQPDMCLITSIGFDHTDLLGDTLDKIASEKAGIIKSDTPVVIGEFQNLTWPVFKAKAEKEHSKIILPETQANVVQRGMQHIDISYKGEVYTTDICADYFAKNLPGILESAEVLRDLGYDISSENIRSGLSNIIQKTGLKGRYQIIGKDPLVVADVSHNQQGIETLMSQIKSTKPLDSELHLIFGTVKDKHHDDILALLPKDARFYFTQSSVSRSLDAGSLREMATFHQLEGASYSNVNLAIEQARKIAKSNDIILITGSTFVVAEIEGI